MYIKICLITGEEGQSWEGEVDDRQRNGETRPTAVESGMERAMPSLCPQIFFMTKEGEGGLIRFSDLALMMFARTELSGKRRSEDGTSLPDSGKTDD